VTIYFFGLNDFVSRIFLTTVSFRVSSFWAIFYWEEISMSTLDCGFDDENLY
jgi:hypothetical protein